MNSLSKKKLFGWVDTVRPLLLAASLALASASAAVATPETTKPSAQFLDSLGVNVHLTGSSDPNCAWTKFSTVLGPRLAALGIKHFRDELRLPNPATTTMFQTLYSRGIKADLIAMLYYGEMQPTNIPKSIAAIGPAVESIEGPNEPDIVGDKNYATNLPAYCKAVYQNVKASYPTMPVIGPSILYPAGATSVGSLSSCIDYGNLHAYSIFFPEDNAYWFGLPQQLQRQGPSFPGKTAYVTEFGWQTAGVGPNGSYVSELTQAKYISRAYLNFFNNGIPRSYLYEFLDPYTIPQLNQMDITAGLLDKTGKPVSAAAAQAHAGNLGEDSFGMVDAGSRTKPSYNMMWGLIHVVGNTDAAPAAPKALDYTLTGTTQNVKHTLLQGRNGAIYLVLWQAVSSWDNANMKDIVVPPAKCTLNLTTPASTLKYYDLSHVMCNPIVPPNATYTKTQSLQLSIPDYPVIVEVIPGSI